jgi:putative peptide zinc metalloprotease protein
MELWISIFAGCVYLNSNTGFSHTLAAGIWLMCTVGTLVLNGNPCFRYDGYYILSDITNTPNLTLQSSQSLWSLFIQTLGGRKVDASAFDQKVSVLAAFAFVSGLYRWSVLVLLVIFLWRWLTPNGLGFIFVAISTAISLGLILQVRRFIQSLASEFFTKQPISPIRTVGLVACLFGLALAVVFLPIPQRARLRGFVERIDSVPIYAPEAGVLERVSMDSRISSGELILKLRNSQLEYDLLTIEQEIELLEIRESILEKSRAQQDQVDYELPTIREYHRELELKKALMQKEFEKLTLIASTDDVELTYAELSIGHPKGGYSPQPIREDQTTLDYVLTQRNLGTAVERGTLLGRINAPSGLTVRGFISENHLKEIQSEYPDATFFNRSLSLEGIAINDAFSGRWVWGGLTRVARDPVERVPQELTHDAQIATQSTSGGELQFESPHYPVEFQIKDSPQSWIRGDLVSVYLTLPSKTIVEIMWDAVQDAIRIQR